MGNHRNADVRPAPEVEHATANTFQFLDGLERIVMLLKDAAGIIHHHLSGLRQREPAASALIQLGAGLVLQAADLLEYRRGREMDPSAGPAEGTQLGDGDERAKVREFHWVGLVPQSIIALDSEIWNDQF